MANITLANIMLAKPSNLYFRVVLKKTCNIR